MYCKKCGAEMGDGVQFCPKCGQSAGEAVRQPAAGAEKTVLLKKFGVHPSQKKLGYFILICGAVAFLFGIIILFVGISNLSGLGWKWSSKDAKDEVITGIICLVCGLLFALSAPINLRSCVSVFNNKVCGIPYMLKATNLEVPYPEILSVKSNKKGGIILETVKGTYALGRIESAEECVELIRSRMEED